MSAVHGWLEVMSCRHGDRPGREETQARQRGPAFRPVLGRAEGSAVGHRREEPVRRRRLDGRHGERTGRDRSRIDDDDRIGSVRVAAVLAVQVADRGLRVAADVGVPERDVREDARIEVDLRVVRRHRAVHVGVDAAVEIRKRVAVRVVVRGAPPRVVRQLELLARRRGLQVEVRVRDGRVVRLRPLAARARSRPRRRRPLDQAVGAAEVQERAVVDPAARVVAQVQDRVLAPVREVLLSQAHERHVVEVRDRHREARVADVAAVPLAALVRLVGTRRPLDHEVELDLAAEALVEVEAVVAARVRRDVLEVRGAAEGLDLVVLVLQDLDVVEARRAAHAAQRQAVDLVVRREVEPAVPDRRVLERAAVGVVAVPAVRAGQVGLAVAVEPERSGGREPLDLDLAGRVDRADRVVRHPAVGEEDDPAPLARDAAGVLERVVRGRRRVRAEVVVVEVSEHDRGPGGTRRDELRPAGDDERAGIERARRALVLAAHDGAGLDRERGAARDVDRLVEDVLVRREPRRARDDVGVDDHRGRLGPPDCRAGDERARQQCTEPLVCHCPQILPRGKRPARSRDHIGLLQGSELYRGVVTKPGRARDRFEERAPRRRATHSVTRSTRSGERSVTFAKHRGDPPVAILSEARRGATS